MSLSVVIICFNEEKNIEKTLTSVTFADEIIIVDSGSTDQTLTIAKKYSDQIYHQDWLGFGRQKQFALSKATKDWVLSIDADEVISDSLKDEIKNMLESKQTHDAFMIPFHSYFLGKQIKHGDWKKESHLRLFKRDKAQFDDAELHENLILDKNIKIGHLKNHIDHYSYSDLADVLDKLKRYSYEGAKSRFAQGKTASPLSAWLKGKWAFFRSYYLKQGFLDGREGFLLAKYISDYTFYRYAQLNELQNNKNQRE